MSVGRLISPLHSPRVSSFCLQNAALALHRSLILLVMLPERVCLMHLGGQSPSFCRLSYNYRATSVVTTFVLSVQAEAAARAAGENPTIVRNQGSIGARDLHLENFSVSNGGKDLIEVCYFPDHGRNFFMVLVLGDSFEFAPH